MYIDAKSVDKAAKALFNHIFRSCRRIDPTYLWETVPHKVREGFREEVRVIFKAIDE